MGNNKANNFFARFVMTMIIAIVLYFVFSTIADFSKLGDSVDKHLNAKKTEISVPVQIETEATN